MMWKVWIGIEYAPYCFSWSSVKFQGHTGQKIANFYPNGVRFWTSCNSSLNTIMATNDTQSFKRYTRGAILFFKVIRQISRSHRATICNIFYPNWVFPDCTSGLNSLMVTNDAQSFKGHTRGAIFFQGHLSNFKVTRAKEAAIWLWFERFQKTTPIWIHGWLKNYTLCFYEHGRGAMLLFLGHLSNHKVTQSEKLMIWLQFECFQKTQIGIHRWLWNYTHGFWGHGGVSLVEIWYPMMAWHKNQKFSLEFESWQKILREMGPWFNIGSGNGLFPDGPKQLPEQLLTPQ